MKFKVGDVCVITEIAFPEKFRGLECAITGDLKWQEDIYEPLTNVHDPGWYYEILIAGEKWPRYAKPHELRLRRPPSWDKWLYDTRDVESKQPVDV